MMNDLVKAYKDAELKLDEAIAAGVGIADARAAFNKANENYEICLQRSITGKCVTHDVPLNQQDAGRGKWVPICPECESERKQRIAEAFKDSFAGGMYGQRPSVPFHPECGAYHAEGSCPSGSPRGYNNGDIWLV